MDDSFTLYELNQCKLYYKGFLYSAGYRSGEETAQWFLGYYNRERKIPFERLRGAFSAVLQDGETFYAFSDNSNQNCLFYNDNMVACRMDLLLNIACAEGKMLRWDILGLCEYLTLGKELFERTLVDGVFILHAERYLQISDGTVAVKDKGIGKIDGNPGNFEPETFYKELAYALPEKQFVTALTGGYDSRMVTAQLSQWADVSPMICSNLENSPEEVVAHKVSLALGKNLDVVRIPSPDYTDTSLQLLLEEDDMAPVDCVGNYIQSFFKKHLSEKNITLFVTGDGGVLHKDWEWMQDLPFYHRRKTNLNRFYNQRIEFLKYNNYLGDKLCPVYINQKERILAHLKEYSRSINTQIYDFLYYYISGNRRLYYNLHEFGVFMYAPLNEFEYVRYSYHLPRRKRFFYNQIRKLTTSANKRVARIPTNYATTASSEVRYLMRDIFLQGIDYSKKAVRMLGRKFFNRSFFVSAPFEWNIDDLCTLPYASEALDYAKKNGLVDAHVTVETIPVPLLGRLIHVYNWYERFSLKF